MKLVIFCHGQGTGFFIVAFLERLLLLQREASAVDQYLKIRNKPA
jgi:hypothetical protein